MTIMVPITTMQDVDMRILQARDVCFTHDTAVLPSGTLSWPGQGKGTASTGTKEHGTIERQSIIARYLLPCGLEISYHITTERHLVSNLVLLDEKTITIPFEPAFIWTPLLNTDPAFKEEYNAIKFSSLTGNWHNEEMNAQDREGCQ